MPTTNPLAAAEDLIAQFCVMSDGQRLLVASWAAHTWVYKQWGATPRLYFNADRPGAGKSTAMQVALAMSCNSLPVGYASQASIYGWLEEHPETTLGLDEADQIFGVTGRKTSRSVLLAVLNDGYSSEGKVLVVRGGKATRIPVFAPVAFAGIGTLPGPLLSRSVVITLEPAVPPLPWLPEVYAGELGIVGSQFADWLKKPATKRKMAAAPDLAPTKGDPRQRQILAPLHAICDAAGQTERFLAAVTELQDRMAAKQPVDRVELLMQDLRAVWPGDTPLLRASEVINALHGHDAARWKSLTPDNAGARVLAGLFHERAIETRTRDGKRGYLRADVIPVA